ncbi:methyltransferase domain-containing protein [Streptacidiphilus sp. 4-A2]|nr:methyltransferase domain-containing protein [Streptacidiphilus sp. 4-A2]
MLGRNDDQVKLRGYRIELGDIETAVLAHEDIAQAVVVGRDGQLVAYCVRDQEPVAAAPEAAGSSAAGVEAAAGAEAEARGAALAEWAGAWDRAYEAGTGAQDATFNLAGWHNSYDGLPFSDAEMRDWQSGSVKRILAQSPGNVFEIGSGSGLMLFAVAPHATSYRAVDASPRAVELTRAQLASLPQVSCECLPAHELPEVAAGSLDTVIVNSVAQYLADYLTAVLEWAVRSVGSGRVFLGDLRDLELLKIFHADVIDFRGNGGVPSGELAHRAGQAVRASANWRSPRSSSPTCRGCSRRSPASRSRCATAGTATR